MSTPTRRRPEEPDVPDTVFPIVPDSALRATLGILERTVRHGLPPFT